MKRAFPVAVALVGVAFVAALLWRAHEPLGLDQGLFACFARWAPPQLPYRDIFDSKPPLFLYSYSLARLFPGEIVGKIWWLEAVWLAAMMAAAFAVAARAWGRWAGLAAAALLFFGEWSPGWGGYWSRAQADEFVALPLVLAAGYAWKAPPGKDDRRFDAFYAGLLTGVAGLFKIPAMAAAAAWTLTWRLDARKIALLILGMAAPWALAAGWFAAHGAFGDFIEGVLVYHRYNAEYIAPPWGDVLAGFFSQMLTQAPLLLFLAAVGVWKEPRRLAPWIGFSLAAVILERQLAEYQFLLAIPALALAGARGVVALSRKAWVVAAALAIVGGWQWQRAYSHPDFERGIVSPAIEMQAAEYLRARSQTDDKVLVWGLGPGIYALADRQPATRYPFHKILLTDAPLSTMIPGLEERRAQFLASFDRAPPRYILVGRGDRNGFEPEDSYLSLLKFDGLHERLARDYQKETEIGRFLLFVRR